MRRSVLLLACALVACNRPPDQPGPAPMAPVATAQAAASFSWEQAKVTEQVEVDALKRRITKLETESRLRQLEGAAEFDPQEPKRFQVVKAPVGNIMFVLERLEPYLDGYTVSFRLGNPTSATLNGIKGKIGWGPAFDINKAETYALKEKAFEDVTSFAPGSWTTFKVSIAPATADQTRRISIEPLFEQLSLRAPANNAR